MSLLPIILRRETNDKVLGEPEDGYDAGCIIEENEGRVVLTLPNGAMISMAKDGLSYLNVNLGSETMVVGQYEQKLDRPYCCVTCYRNGQTTVCGDTACCLNPNGSWTCC